MKKCDYKKKVVKHLKGDIKDFHKEASEDKALIKILNKGKPSSKKDDKKKDPKKYDPKKKHVKDSKFDKVMHEWKEGDLHSSSKKGPKVKSQKQALAIAFSEARRAKKKK